MSKPCIYLVGSLRNHAVPDFGNALRAHGFDVFDDWFSAGPEADDKWQEYERRRGRTHAEALASYHAKHVFSLDYTHLNRASAGIMVMPAGKSGHLELGYLIGQGKPGFILFDQEPERFDVMHLFATLNGGGIFYNAPELIAALKRCKMTKD